MMPPKEEVLLFVRHMAPTWRTEGHKTCAEVLGAFWDRACLCLSDLARAMSAPQQPLHGRLKRLTRWLDNPHLDELALQVPSGWRWPRLTYEWVVQLPGQPRERPLLPILLDTVYFQPFAVLLASVPCGSRGLPIALTTYHRKTLEASFPPERVPICGCWPDRTQPTSPFWRQRQGLPARPAPSASTSTPFLGQNRIEEHLLTLVLRLVCPALRRRPPCGVGVWLIAASPEPASSGGCRSGRATSSFVSTPRRTSSSILTSRANPSRRPWRCNGGSSAG